MYSIAPVFSAVVLGEQYYGAHATEKPLLVTSIYSAYVIMPILLLVRVRHPAVFAPYSKGAAKGSAAAQPAPKTKAQSPRLEKSPSRRHARHP